MDTPRLTLREFTSNDAQNLFELDSDPRVTRYTSSAGTTPNLENIAAVEIPEYLRGYRRTPGFGVFAAIEKPAGEFVGWFMLRRFAEASYCSEVYPNPDDMELGYRLKQSAWGRGLASEGVEALLDYAFGKMGVEAVMAVVLPENTASVRVLVRNGFKRVAPEDVELLYYRRTK